MRLCLRKIFLTGGLTLLVFTGLAFASDHRTLNGTWTLAPSRSEFNGQPAIQTGKITINNREHNIFISRNFNYDGANGSFEYTYTVDGHENTSIKEGKAFKTKAKWDDNALKVKTTQNGIETTESYSLAPDGSMVLVVDRPGHAPLALRFQRAD